VIRVLGEDGKPNTVKITDKDGEANPDEGIYNLTAGKYDLTVKAGASYTTQREEALDLLTNLVQANKDIAPIVGDKIVELMDIPGGDVISKRLQAMLPPQVQQAEQGDDPQLNAAQQHIQQLEGVIQQGMQHIQELEQEKDLEGQKLDIERYKAETERLQATAQQVPLEALPELMAQALGQILTAPQELPPEREESMPTQGVEPQPEPQGQPAQL
jgi:hypothetical protein